VGALEIPRVAGVARGAVLACESGGAAQPSGGCDSLVSNATIHAGACSGSAAAQRPASHSAELNRNGIRNSDLATLDGGDGPPSMVSALRVAVAVRNLDAIRVIATRLGEGPRRRRADGDEEVKAGQGEDGAAADPVLSEAKRVLAALDGLRCYVAVQHGDRACAYGVSHVSAATAVAANDEASAWAACSYLASGAGDPGARTVSTDGHHRARAHGQGASPAAAPFKQPSDGTGALDFWEGYTYVPKLQYGDGNCIATLNDGEAGGRILITEQRRPDAAFGDVVRSPAQRTQQKLQQEQQPAAGRSASGAAAPRGRRLMPARPLTSSRWSLVAVAAASGTCCVVTSSDGHSDLDCSSTPRNDDRGSIEGADSRSLTSTGGGEACSAAGLSAAVTQLQQGTADVPGSGVCSFVGPCQNAYEAEPLVDSGRSPVTHGNIGADRSSGNGFDAELDTSRCGVTGMPADSSIGGSNENPLFAVRQTLLLSKHLLDLLLPPTSGAAVVAGALEARNSSSSSSVTVGNAIGRLWDMPVAVAAGAAATTMADVFRAQNGVQ
jgi:hypothetical protein